MNGYYNNDSKARQKHTVAELPCQNCGRLVTVSLPFIGCVFCRDCTLADSSWDADSEHFKKAWLFSQGA